MTSATQPKGKAESTTLRGGSPSPASPQLHVGWSDDFHTDPILNFQLNRWYQYGGPRWLGDVRPVLPKLTSLDAWKDTFLALGERALADGRPFHAALDLRAAEFFMTVDDPRKEPTRRRLLPLLRAGSGVPDSARRWVAFEGAQLPAWHFVPERSKGTFVVFGGYDSYIEEFFPWISKMRDDGWTVVAFEGPGQGTPLEESKTVITPEWHRAVGAILDAFALDDVTLLGVSLGGCLVMRAAAFEPRVRRVIAFDVLSDFYATLTSPLPAAMRALADAATSDEGKSRFDAALREAMTKSTGLDWIVKQGLHVLGGKTPSDLYALARNFQTRDVSGRVRQDVLLMAGTEDLAAPLDQAWEQGRLLTAARSTTIRVFTREEHAQMHCQLGNTPLAVGLMESWAEERSRTRRA
jgi:alpha-beta hydrolase superfamily lysophospholipase